MICLFISDGWNGCVYGKELPVLIFCARGQGARGRGQGAGIRSQKSEVRSQRHMSEVICQRSYVRGHISEVRSQRLEVIGHRYSLT